MMINVNIDHIYSLEIFNDADIHQTFSQIASTRSNLNIRSLTEGEILISKTVFGDLIDYQKG